MSDQTRMKTPDAQPSVECLASFVAGDVEDLCDATELAIKAGGGFGWLDVPQRDVLERYWDGVLTMPSRHLLVARLDGVICGTCQLMKPPHNNEAQAHSVHLTTHFIAPWARGYGLSEMLIGLAETTARDEGFSVINLDVRETLEDAIALYEKLEFQRIGEHPCYAKVEERVLKGYYYCKVLS